MDLSTELASEMQRLRTEAKANQAANDHLRGELRALGLQSSWRIDKGNGKGKGKNDNGKIKQNNKDGNGNGNGNADFKKRSRSNGRGDRSGGGRQRATKDGRR